MRQPDEIALKFLGSSYEALDDRSRCLLWRIVGIRRSFRRHHDRVGGGQCDLAD
jgi:hypothetical protein